MSPKKMSPLSSSEMVKWLRGQSTVYASSKAYNGESLLLLVSGDLRFIVIHGESFIYEGIQAEEAVNEFNNLL